MSTRATAPTASADGGFCEYQVNHINIAVSIADEMSDEEATWSSPPAPPCTA
jgi:hypothetical protein